MQLLLPSLRTQSYRPSPAQPMLRRQARKPMRRRRPPKSGWRGPLFALGGSIWLAMVGCILIREFGKKPQIADMDPARGKGFYQQSCVVCHGVSLQGMPHQGVNLRHSKFVAASSDPSLHNFIKVGRKPGDPGSIQGLTMPPRGGNPTLSDSDLMDVVAYLRQVQKQALADQPDDDETSVAGM